MMLRRNKIHPMVSSFSQSTNTVLSSLDEIPSTIWQLSLDEKRIVQAAWEVLSQDLEEYGCQVLNRLERLSPEAYSAYTTETPISDVTSDYSCSVSSTADSYMSGGGGYTLQQPCGIAAFRCHAKRTMDTYGMVVYGLDELDAIYPLLKSTGRRLARKGVQAQHLQAMSRSVMGMAESVFAGHWTLDWSKAWLALTTLVENGHLAGVHGEQADSLPMYLPLSPAVPDYHHGYLSSPSAGSWSSNSAGSSLSSFSLSPQSASSCSTSSVSGDDTSPKFPRDRAWANQPTMQAWPAMDDSFMVSSPAAAHSHRWCVNIPALLRTNKKQRRRSDPSPPTSSSSKHGRLGVPKWMSKSTMLQSKFGLPYDSRLKRSGNTFDRKSAHRSMSNLI